MNSTKQSHTSNLSDLYSIQTALNPLVAINAPLLSLASQLVRVKKAPDLTRLHEHLNKEIRTMESKAHDLGYSSQVILAARFFICSLLDEFILTTDWGSKQGWQKYSLVYTFQNGANSSEQFFIILASSLEEPSIYIDALELGYICLSLGYLGKYRNQPNRYELDLLQDKTYEVIRQTRGESSHILLKKSKKIKKVRKGLWTFPPIWVTAIIGIVILVAIFIPYYHHLNKVTRPVQQSMEILGQQNA